MEIFETHAHLCDAQFDPDRAETLRRAAQAGVTMMVEIADSPGGWEKARSLARETDEPKVYWSCGFHPHYAGPVSNFDFDIMKKAALSERCVAVGEIGLDYVKSASPREDQIALFRQALEVAAECEKPVVIHCRQAQADTLRILRSFYGGHARAEGATGVVHCFSGDADFAQGVLELGFFLGVDGPLTYPSAKELRHVIAGVPLERIVLETDSPYLPPQPFRGKRNEPSHLPLVAEALAQCRGVRTEEAVRRTTENARILFRIKK